MRALEADPWTAVAEKWPAGSQFTGKVVRKSDFGWFVELAEGVEGLLHPSQLAPGMTEKDPKLAPGETIEGWVREVEPARHRISLALREVPAGNPWQGAEKKYLEGEVVTGTVEKIAPFGAFIVLEPGLTGLLPTSEMGLPRGASVGKAYPVGKQISLKVAEVDTRRKRISLTREDKTLEGSKADYQAFVKKTRKNERHGRARRRLRAPQGLTRPARVAPMSDGQRLRPAAGNGSPAASGCSRERSRTTSAPSATSRPARSTAGRPPLAPDRRSPWSCSPPRRASGWRPARRRRSAARGARNPVVAPAAVTAAIAGTAAEAATPARVPAQRLPALGPPHRHRPRPRRRRRRHAHPDRPRREGPDARHRAPAGAPARARRLRGRAHPRRRQPRARCATAPAPPTSTHADLFVSIHVNWFKDGRANRGIETYFLGPSDDPFITELASAENRESGYSIADVRRLLDSIYADLRQEQSRALASEVQRRLLRSLREIAPEVADRGVKSAPFLVLVATEMPAILAEVACLSNDDEARLLAEEAYRERIAVALFEGIRSYSRAGRGRRARRLRRYR